MRFGPVPLDEAEGAVLAHSVRLPGRPLKKGRVLSPEDVVRIREAGLNEVVAARLDAGDVAEDPAAARLAEAVLGPGLRAGAAFTGRCNLYAETDGLLVVDEAALERVNLVSEELTVATVRSMTVVAERQLVATIKIIPLACAESNLEVCESAAAAAAPLVRVAPFRPRAVAYVQTRLAGTRESVLDKSARVLAERLGALGSEVVSEERCAHDAEAVAGAVGRALEGGAEMVLIAGASAIVDRRDVVPAGIVAAGGTLEHYGMPVEPGNLLLLARHGEVPVLGLPGCARSPAISGFDFVLQRLVADIPVTPRDLVRMGSHGLLKAPAAQARRSQRAAAEPVREPDVAAIVLAAGQSRRMGEHNKLLEHVDGAPMVARVAATAVGSAARSVIVVTGHEHERVGEALSGLDVTVVHNPDFAQGLSTSLRRGLDALPGGTEAVLICLGDMPRVPVGVLDRLIAAFDPAEGRSICVPTFAGKRGNPVLFAATHLARMREATGDVGARHLLDALAEEVCEVEMEQPGILVDVDSPEALARVRRGKAEAEVS